MITTFYIEAPIPLWDKFVPSSKLYNQQKHNALDYSRTVLLAKDLKNETIKYLKKHCDVNITKATNVDDWKYITIGKYCWMLNNGAIFDKSTEDFFIFKLTDIIKIITTNIDKIKNKTKKNIVDLSKILFEDFEDLIILDNLSNNGAEAYDILCNAKPTFNTLILLNKKIKKHIKYIKSFPLDELHQAYPYYEKDINNWLIMIRSLNSFKQNEKTKRARNKKSFNIFLSNKQTKIVNDMQYQKEDKTLQLVSISPKCIINANVLILFNTKTRKLSIIYSDINSGLEIRGTTIHNINILKSYSKILRNPEKQLSSIKNSSLKRIEIIMSNNINSKAQSVMGRTNNHTILIKVW